MQAITSFVQTILKLCLLVLALTGGCTLPINPIMFRECRSTSPTTRLCGEQSTWVVEFRQDLREKPEMPGKLK